MNFQNEHQLLPPRGKATLGQSHPGQRWSDVEEDTFLIPLPQSDSKKPYSPKPKYDIEAKNEVFDATIDFRTLVVHPLRS